MNITSDSINRELWNLSGRKRVKPKVIKDRADDFAATYSQKKQRAKNNDQLLPAASARTMRHLHFRLPPKSRVNLIWGTERGA
jgi:hypothetical protein